MDKEMNEALGELAENGEFPILDIILDELKQELAKSQTLIVNPKRLREMSITYNSIKKIVRATSPDAKITCGIDKLFRKNGYVEIETDEIEVRDIQQFISGIQYASNFETHPLLNGNIALSIGFQDIMIEIPQE